MGHCTLRVGGGPGELPGAGDAALIFRGPFGIIQARGVWPCPRTSLVVKTRSRGRLPLAFRGERPGKLLTVLQCPVQPLPRRMYPAFSANRAEFRNLSAQAEQEGRAFQVLGDRSCRELVLSGRTRYGGGLGNGGRDGVICRLRKTLDCPFIGGGLLQCLKQGSVMVRFGFRKITALWAGGGWGRWG